MPARIAQSVLNASTADILNVIRSNASYEYQSLVPVVTTATDIPKVGEIILGYPALANQACYALMNQIALVDVKSAVFNNPYADLKKGLLRNGETVEEVFVEMAKAREFSVEKAPAREFKRTIPDVRTAFHARNWKVQYPVSIEYEELRLAFQSENGLQDLIARITASLQRANEYDEYLLFKFLIIKACSHGMMYPVSVTDSGDLKGYATAFREYANRLQFISDKYNMAGVHTNTPISDMSIFMDAGFNAGFDVNVLSASFHMERAEFMGKLRLIDSFTTFDNDRFAEIMAGSDQIESVTDAELALMANVKAILLDKEWFQVYDNLMLMTEKQVSAGLYWNYFLTVWKTISSSPFSNAIVFVDSSMSASAPTSLTFVVSDLNKTADATIFSLSPKADSATAQAIKYQDDKYEFIQGGDITFDGSTVEYEELVKAGVAVMKYGTYIVPDTVESLAGDYGGLYVKACGKVYHCTFEDENEDDIDVADLTIGTELVFNDSDT